MRAAATGSQWMGIGVRRIPWLRRARVVIPAFLEEIGYLLVIAAIVGIVIDQVGLIVIASAGIAPDVKGLSNLTTVSI